MEFGISSIDFLRASEIGKQKFWLFLQEEEEGVSEKERALHCSSRGGKQVRVEAFFQDGNPFRSSVCFVRGNGRPAA